MHKFCMFYKFQNFICLDKDNTDIVNIELYAAITVICLFKYLCRVIMYVSRYHRKIQ